MGNSNDIPQYHLQCNRAEYKITPHNHKGKLLAYPKVEVL